MNGRKEETINNTRERKEKIRGSTFCVMTGCMENLWRRSEVSQIRGKFFISISVDRLSGLRGGKPVKKRGPHRVSLGGAKEPGQLRNVLLFPGEKEAFCRVTDSRITKK